jgi:hypothetical protein
MIRKSLLKFFIFFILLLTVNFFLDNLYKSTITAASIEGRKDNQFDNYNDTLKYLLLGDSHIQNAIDPRILKNSFNYSSANENYIQTYYKLKTIVKKKNKTPECIVLPIDISSFSGFRSDRFKYDAYWIRFMDYFELKKEKNNWDFISKWLSGSFFSYAGNYETIFRYILVSRNTLGELHFGYKARYEKLSEKNDKFEFSERRAKLYLDSTNYFDRDLSLYFQNILSFCNSNNIEVILIRLPIDEHYYKIAGKLIPINKYYEKIDAIISEHKNICYKIDYHNLFFGKQEFLRNPDHVNFKGAPIVSQMLLEKLNKKR